MISKGYYFSLLLFGLFGVVSLQKAVRDRIEGVPVTAIYYGLSWVAVGAAVLLLTVGLWESPDLIRSEKGFYGMAYVLALFAAVAVQKNVRDLEFYPKPEKDDDGDEFMQSAIEELAS